MDRGGGFGGADLEAIAAECVEGEGSCCEREYWIEKNAALCVVGVNPEQSGDFSVQLFYLDYLETAGQGGERVLWGVDDQMNSYWLIDACDGSLFGSFIYEPN